MSSIKIPASVRLQSEIGPLFYPDFDGREQVQVLIRKYGVEALDSARNDRQHGLIQDAVLNDRSEVPRLSVYLNAGLNPNVQDDGNIPLSIAAYKSADHTVQLLEHGADVHAIDPDGMTAMHMAAMGSQPDSPKSIEALLNYGATIDAVDNMGNTPLAYAVASESTMGTENVQRLLDRGADPVRAMQGERWKTALEAAPTDDLVRARVNLVLDHQKQALRQAVAEVEQSPTDDAPAPRARRRL